MGLVGQQLWKLRASSCNRVWLHWDRLRAPATHMGTPCLFSVLQGLVEFQR